MIPYHLFCDKIIENLLKSHEENVEFALEWFENNYMRLNTDKCHLLISDYKHGHIWAKVGEDKIWERSHVKLLVITTDRELKFDKHVPNLCSKVSWKLSALSIMSNFLSFDKKKTLFKGFVESQCKYCPPCLNVS